MLMGSRGLNTLHSLKVGTATQMGPATAVLDRIGRSSENTYTALLNSVEFLRCQGIGGTGPPSSMYGGTNSSECSIDSVN